MNEDDPRSKAREFVAFIQSLPEAERIAGNEMERQRALAQHKEFQAHFHAGSCFLCGDALNTFSSEKPCIHWLLRPPGFTKRRFMEVARRYGYSNIEAFLRWVAGEEAFAKNINDLRDEGTGKLIELTIRYKEFEWSFSCSESDFVGHATDSEESRRPHYHFQMRVKKQAFIRFNDFHVPFSATDVLMIEAQRIAPEVLQQRFSAAPGMNDVLAEDILEHLVMHGMSAKGSEDDAPIELNTFIMADEGKTISGEVIANLFEEAKRKGVPVSSLVHKLQDVSVQTVVSPGPGVVEQTPRSGRKKGKRK